MSAPQALTLRELCALARLSESTVRRHVKSGKLPALQPGGPGSKLLFPADALERSARHDREAPPPAAGPTPVPGPPPRWRAGGRPTTH